MFEQIKHFFRDNIYLLIFIAAKLYYFAPHYDFYPVHDTSCVFHFFHYYYNEYYINNTIPLWAPYNLYGTQTDYYISIAMSVTLYLVALIGKLLHIKNSLFLFKAGLIMEEYLFVYGTYLLSKRLFTSRIAQLFVTLGAITATQVQAQIYLNFRFYYLFPLILLLLINFFDKRRFYFLWLSVTVTIISLCGNTTYYAPIYLFIGLIFISSMIYFVNRNIKQIVIADIFSTLSLMTLTLMCVTAYIYIDMTTHVFDNIIVYARQRLPGMTSNTFSGFIDYADGTIYNLWQFIYAAPTTTDQVLFIGTIPIVFIIYAFIYETRNMYLPVFAVTAFIIAMLSLSRAAFVDYIIYYAIPYMSQARHLGLMLSPVKLFLLVIAGFGVNKFYNKVKSNDGNNECINKEIKIIMYITAALVAFIVFNDLLFSNKFPYPDSIIVPYSFHYFSLLLLIGFIFYLLRSIKNRGILFRYAVILFFFVEIFSYYFIIMHGLASRLEPDNINTKTESYLYSDYQRDLVMVKEIFNVQPHKYQNIRYPYDNTTNKLLSLEKYMTAGNSIEYSAYYIDSCIPKYRYDIRPAGIDWYIKAIYGLDSGIDKMYINIVTDFTMIAGDKVSMSIVGCNRSKLWITSDVVFADNIYDAASKIGLLGTQPDLYSRPVLLKNSVEEYVLSHSAEKNETINISADDSNKISIEGENIKVLYFTANTIILEAFTDNEKAWLIYADSYNPNWTVSVNGKYRAVAMANLAFKAVKLDKGNNKVIFNFKGNHRTPLYVRYFIALSVLFWLYILFITIKPEFIVSESPCKQ